MSNELKGYLGRVSLTANSDGIRFAFFALSLLLAVGILDFALVVGSFSSIEKTILTLVALVVFGIGMAIIIKGD